MREAQNSQVVLRLPQPLRAKIERAAAEDRRTLADFLRLVISDALAKGRQQPTAHVGKGA